MRVVAYGNLRDYGLRHPDAKPSLKRWNAIVRKGRWRTMQEVAANFGSAAKVLNDSRCRFAIHGGSCRLIVSFDFRRQAAYLKFIGTHPESDQVDALTVAQF